MGINGNNQVCRHKQGSNLGKEQHILPIEDTHVFPLQENEWICYGQYIVCSFPI